MKKEEFKFVNLRYKPKSDDLVCLFRVEPMKSTIKKALSSVQDFRPCLN